MPDDFVAARVAAYLEQRSRRDLIEPARHAAERASALAQWTGVPPQPAEDAAWLAVVGDAVPSAERIARAESDGLVLTPADRESPDVVAARLSASIAQRDLAVADAAVLDAVRFAPTIRYGADDLDKVVFLAWHGADPHAPTLEEAVFDALTRLRADGLSEGKPRHPDIAAAWTDAAQHLGRLPAAWLAVEDSVKWDAGGLVVAVVQDAETRAVLTVAYMSREALRLCLATGETHFWSRSRREIWHKGRTSGHTQRIVAMRLDCDRDAVLVEVTPNGPACHTGAVSCFFTPVSLNIP
ncbi:MAG: phosphoribosyl-AMP cyclohydrolase [Anaerolineae bacterium]